MGMITVREATRSDVDNIYGLLMALAEHHGQTDFVWTSKTELARAGFGDDPKFFVLLAEDDGAVIGFLSYTLDYSIWLGDRYMNIDDVYVEDGHRGRGVGEALMHQSREFCKVMGISRLRWEVEKDNDKAIRFYERLGAKYHEKGIFRWDTAE